MGIAVVTGSASGIGAAVRARLEKNGDRVIGIDLRNAEIEVDLSTPEGRKRSIAQALEACGAAWIAWWWRPAWEPTSPTFSRSHR